MSEKILTLHPDGKKGVNIALAKYEIIKKYIISILKKEGTLTYQDLNTRAINELTPTFDGKVGWYLVTVKLDLEARGVIRRIPKTSPHQIELVDK
ncbi:hypothetical protein NBT05_12065 [Aquimarina sp. ERC-38]|uniref:DUF6958 family protein n=1 Tax=Aquimarina sp. ERC-38 TaxID=2949996 RepID=UPI00224556E8|nr:hypothetical protein [Aquimarina sp. ERC-38]UZO79686.1 hypothetical protein NBT05_12065 [Aquimarina sp. ERC-38]